jgi:hypothetical protein
VRNPGSTLLFLLAALLYSVPSAFGDSLSPDGLLVYDNGLQIYWMQNANPLGMKTWQEAYNWADQLKYGGYDDWRLPATTDGDWGYDRNNIQTRYNVTASELGHLFYNSLKLQGKKAPNGTENTIYGLDSGVTPFINLQSGYYWLGPLSKTLAQDGDPMAWIFDFQYGAQFLATADTFAYAIAVRSAAPVPEPSAALLFLAGLFGISRCRNERRR